MESGYKVMGFPPRLNGKNAPLDSDETETCPECHRKFPVYNVGVEGNRAYRECPYCGYDFKPKGNFLKKLFGSK